MRSVCPIMFVILLQTLLWIGLVEGYPGGPPTSVCNSMRPDPSFHTSQPQQGAAPYSLTFSKNTYAANDQITVTLSGDTGTDTFRGFFIQPRTDVGTYTTVGTFSDIPSDARNPCVDDGTTTLSHNSRSDKTSVSFTWVAPSTDVGPVTFVFTVVKTKAVYWVVQQSDPITYQEVATSQGQTPGTTGTTVTTQEQTVTTQPTTPRPNLGINWDPACGSTKGCWPSTIQCTANCEYLVKWMPVSDTEVQFSLQRKAGGDSWIAIGFSDDPGMGNDSVVECVSVNGIVVVRSSYNEPLTARANNVLDTATFGISNTQTSHSEGIIRCLFNRKVSVGAVTGRKKRAATDGTTFFDLNTEWFLLIAMGGMNGTTKNKHSLKFTTSEKIDFLTVAGAGTQEPVVAGEVNKPAACGKTEGCFHDCDSSGKQCTFYVSWKENGGDIDMTIRCKQKSGRYCAIGLSGDQNMGEDSVTECVAEGTSATVYVSYNNGRTNARLSPGTLGLTNINGAIQDGVVTCSFSRKKTAVASQSNYFNMDDDWFLLFATGPASGGNIFQHDSPPVRSAQKADFQSVQDLGAEAVTKVLVKVHGILMIVAWMMFCSIGIVCPRFYKPAWPEDTQLCGQKVWFSVHRFCMVLAFLSCAAAFVVIFVHVGGYAEINGSNFEKAHPIMGIVVMALALINPIMALFRPHPGTPKRPIFNYAHLFVGSGAHIIGIVNLFAGVLLAEESEGVPEYVMIILWVFVGWQILFEIVLHIYSRATSKKGYKGDSYELKGAADSTEGLTSKSDGRDNVKIFALYLHVVVIVGLSIAACVIIGIASHEGHDHDD